MNRRTFLGRSASLSVFAPHAVLLAATDQQEAKPRYLFYGQFGRAIEKEFHHQQDQGLAASSSKRAPDQMKQWLHFVVADLGEGDFVPALEHLEREKDHRDSYYGFFVLNNTWEMDDDKPVQRNEQTWNNHVTARRLCDVFSIIPSLNEKGQTIKDDWPLSWRDQALSIEQKQIVWELLKLS